MKKLLLLGVALTAGAIGMQDVSVGHGGTYRGPGDTVPPGGGGGGGGGGPSTPGPAGPSAPGPSGPSTPGPAAPGAPGGGGGASTPVTGAGASGPDITIWQYWWGFNKEPYLNLRAAVRAGGIQTGSDTFFLGRGTQDQAKDSMAPSEETIRQKIVPALTKALQNETNNDIVTACLVALAKIGDANSEEGTSAFEALIATRLADPVQEIRETAAVALGILANPKSIGTLEGILKETPEAKRELKEEGGINYRTRAFAAYGLGLVGHRAEDPKVREAIVKTLVEVIDSPRMATRDIKVAAVISMGLVPLDVREGALEEGKVEEPWSSRQAQVAYLTKFFEDEKNDEFLVRAHAPRSIAMLLDGLPTETRDAAIESMLKFVGKTAPGEVELRQSCTLAMGLLGDLDADKAGIDAKIRKALIEAAGNADQQTKYFRLIALAQIGGRPGQGENPLAGGKEIEEALMLALVRGKGNEQPWAGLAMGVYQRALLEAGLPQSPEALRALRATLESEKTGVDVGAYALGLGIARDLDSQQILMEKLDATPEDAPRGDIAVALGLMNSGEAKQKIQEIVKKSQYRAELLKNAAIALGLLGDQTIVTELVAMLKDAKTLATQAAIASALGFIGDSRSVDPLIVMLEDSALTDRARAFAGVALGIVADKELLPWNAKISTDLNYRATTTTLTSFSEGTGILDIL